MAIHKDEYIRDGAAVFHGSIAIPSPGTAQRASVVRWTEQDSPLIPSQRGDFFIPQIVGYPIKGKHMAARKLRPKHSEEIKQKIRGTQLINRLQNYALANLTTKVFAKKVMTDGQVRAALGLLKKIVPDVTEATGEIDHNLTVKIVRFGRDSAS